MFHAMSILIEHPGLAAVPSLIFFGLYHLTRRPFILGTASVWMLYGLYEYAMQARILCSGECNIRIDLLAIYPALVVASVVGVIVAVITLRTRSSPPVP